MSMEMLQLVQLMESHRLEVSRLEAQNAKLQQELNNRPTPSLPTELTAENGAKYLLIGEFFEEIELSNPNHCGCGCCDCCADGLDEPETYIQKVPVSWSTIKDIYSKIVSHYLPQPPKEIGND